MTHEPRYVCNMFEDPVRSIHFDYARPDWEEELERLRPTLKPKEFRQLEVAVKHFRTKAGMEA